jgi:hypothetical protein
MGDNSNSGRWAILALVAVGIATALYLGSRGNGHAVRESESAPTSETDGGSTNAPDGGPGVRRIKENCDPIPEAKKYGEFVGREAVAILSWTNMPETVTKLQIPVYVASVDDGAIAVNVLDIPLKDPYIATWIRSGHMRPGQDTALLIDPCSARIEAWEAMDRAKAFGAKQRDP